MRQIVQSKNQYFEKVFRDKDGRLVRATFQIYENAGRIKAKLVNFVYLTAGEISGKVSGLIGDAKNNVSKFSTSLESYLQPTTYNLQTIFSIGSKPRAPTTR